MLPHNHFLIAGLAVAPAAVLVADLPPLESAEWIVTGGLVSAAIDFDILALVLMMSRREVRLRPFRNPVSIFRHFKLFMETITDTGVLKIGLKTHLLFSAMILLLCGLLYPDFIIPVLLGVCSHLLSDIPSRKRLSA